jgi:hypothetical protein
VVFLRACFWHALLIGFGPLLDAFWTAFPSQNLSKTRPKMKPFLELVFSFFCWALCGVSRALPVISRYPPDKERKKQRKKPSGVRKLTGETLSGRAKALGRFPSPEQQ